MAQSWDVLPFLVRKFPWKFSDYPWLVLAYSLIKKFVVVLVKARKKVISHRLFVFAGNFPSLMSRFIFIGFRLPMHTVNAPAFQSWLPSINCPVRPNIFCARFVSILNNNLCKIKVTFIFLLARRSYAIKGVLMAYSWQNPWRYPWSISYLHWVTNWFANYNGYWQYFANSCTLWLEG